MTGDVITVSAGIAAAVIVTTYIIAGLERLRIRYWPLRVYRHNRATLSYYVAFSHDTPAPHYVTAVTPHC